MTEILYKTVVDCSTGIQEQIPYTEEEILEHQQLVAVFQEQEAERVAAAEALATLKTSAKAKLIAGEPLTAEEADTLVI